MSVYYCILLGYTVLVCMCEKEYILPIHSELFAFLNLSVCLQWCIYPTGLVGYFWGFTSVPALYNVYHFLFFPLAPSWLSFFCWNYHETPQMKYWNGIKIYVLYYMSIQILFHNKLATFLTLSLPQLFGYDAACSVLPARGGWWTALHLLLGVW